MVETRKGTSTTSIEADQLQQQQAAQPQQKQIGEKRSREDVEREETQRSEQQEQEQQEQQGKPEQQATGVGLGAPEGSAEKAAASASMEQQQQQQQIGSKRIETDETRSERQQQPEAKKPRLEEDKQAKMAHATEADSTSRTAMSDKPEKQPELQQQGTVQQQQQQQEGVLGGQAQQAGIYDAQQGAVDKTTFQMQRSGDAGSQSMNPAADSLQTLRAPPKAPEDAAMPKSDEAKQDKPEQAMREAGLGNVFARQQQQIDESQKLEGKQPGEAKTSALTADSSKVPAKGSDS